MSTSSRSSASRAHRRRSPIVSSSRWWASVRGRSCSASSTARTPGLDLLLFSREHDAPLRLFHALREIRRIEPSLNVPPSHMFDLQHTPTAAAAAWNRGPRRRPLHAVPGRRAPRLRAASARATPRGVTRTRATTRSAGSRIAVASTSPAARTPRLGSRAAIEAAGGTVVAGPPRPGRRGRRSGRGSRAPLRASPARGAARIERRTSASDGRGRARRARRRRRGLLPRRRRRPALGASRRCGARSSRGGIPARRSSTGSRTTCGPRRSMSETRSVTTLEAASAAAAHQRAWFAEPARARVGGRAARRRERGRSARDPPAFDIPYVVNQWWASLCAAKQKSASYLGGAARPRLSRTGATSTARSPSRRPRGRRPTPRGAACRGRRSSSRSSRTTRSGRSSSSGRARAARRSIRFRPRRIQTSRRRGTTRSHHDWESTIGSARLDLMVEELRGLVDAIEDKTGRRFDEDALAERHAARERAG